MRVRGCDCACVRECLCVRVSVTDVTRNPGIVCSLLLYRTGRPERARARARVPVCESLV